MFLLSEASRHAVGPVQPLIQLVPATLFPEVKQPGREAEQTPNLVARLRVSRTVLPDPSSALHDVYGNNFTFYSRNNRLLLN
jgi:hypothetical protein